MIDDLERQIYSFSKKNSKHLFSRRAAKEEEDVEEGNFILLPLNSKIF